MAGYGDRLAGVDLFGYTLRTFVSRMLGLSLSNTNIGSFGTIQPPFFLQ